jgi:hypothetical protein
LVSPYFRDALPFFLHGLAFASLRSGASLPHLLTMLCATFQTVSVNNSLFLASWLYRSFCDVQDDYGIYRSSLDIFPLPARVVPHYRMRQHCSHSLGKRNFPGLKSYSVWNIVPAVSCLFYV